jgi:short subunit dehydrogenase-like uncharacterized protein
MSESRWMIYGANGYTGELIAREAVARGMRPILAGRSREPVEQIARELGCDARVFDLDAIDLTGISLVLHCAGPFVATSGPMVRACLGAGVHYLDITGEIEVFEAIFARDRDARAHRVTLLPGVGFDVVPTDCLAAMLHSKLPDADDLRLAFFTRRGGISRGTLKTMIEGAGRGGAIRREGTIITVPHLWEVREIPFSSGPRLAATIPWGDVASAYRTTGIPNIRVYSAQSPRAIRRMRRLSPLLPLLRLTPIRRLAQKLAARRSGPSPSERAGARVELWGEVRNARGDEISMTMSVVEGYTFTALAAVAAVERLLAGGVEAGSLTPALAFGAGFITTIPGTVLD